MTLHLKPETETRLLARAQEQGVSVDTLLERLISESEAGPAADKDQIPELPAWHLGVQGHLRRRDIYDNGR